MRYSIPTPTQSQIDIGPFTFHFYALCIIAGIAIAIWLGDRRFRSYGDSAGLDLKSVVSEVAVIAVPAGIIGGRLYHVATSPSAYFGSNGDLLDILKIWKGGLGIWGAISLGALGALFAYRRAQKERELPSFRIFLDALAPGILLAQAIGRFGNWFNAELFGRPLDTWWGLKFLTALDLKVMDYLKLSIRRFSMKPFAQRYLRYFSLNLVRSGIRDRSSTSILPVTRWPGSLLKEFASTQPTTC